MGLYWKSRPVFNTSNMELKFEFGLWVKIILILGSEYPMERSNTWSNQIKTTLKFLWIHKKSELHKQASRWLQPEQRQKQNLNPENLLVQQQSYQCTKEDGLKLSHQNKNLASYDLSKKVISLLRHNPTLQREDGAIQFYKIKFHLRDYHLPIQNWSDDRWIACLAAGGGSNRRYQYCSDYLGSIIYLRALQGHSGGNLIDPTLQDIVVIGSGIFHHIYHIGCAFNLHSIINNGLIPGGQDLSRR